MRNLVYLYVTILKSNSYQKHGLKDMPDNKRTLSDYTKMASQFGVPLGPFQCPMLGDRPSPPPPPGNGPGPGETGPMTVGGRTCCCGRSTGPRLKRRSRIGRA